MNTWDKAVVLSEALGNRAIRVDEQACVGVRNRNATCRRCVEACPAGALTRELNELSLDRSVCSGCGRCVAACPTGVFSFAAQSMRGMLAAADSAVSAGEGLLCVVCEPLFAQARDQIDEAKVLVVPCVACLGEEALVALCARGASRVVLSHGACEAQCSSDLLMAKQAVQEANRLLAAWNGTAKVSLHGKLPGAVRRLSAAAYDEGRREFFSSLGTQARDATIVAAGQAWESEVHGSDGAPEPAPVHKVNDQGNLDAVRVEKREVLLEALDKIAEGQEPGQEALGVRAFQRIAIAADACKSCRMCATFCPTAALRKVDFKDGKTGVAHTPATCVDCGCCVDICPAHALTLHKVATARDVVCRTSYTYRMKGQPVTYNRPDTMYQAMRRVITATDQLYDCQH